MDPNANLSEQLDLCEDIRTSLLAPRLNPSVSMDIEAETLDAECERLVELVESLHTWIQSGGAPPERWITAFVFPKG